MQFDAPTLYFILIGTSLIASIRMFWECRIRGEHRFEVGLWALGLLLVAFGCVCRAVFEHPFVSVGLSNLAICWGYAAAVLGSVRLVGDNKAKRRLVALGLLSAVWLTIGYTQAISVRIVSTSVFVGALCVGAAVALWRAKTEQRLPSQALVAGLFGVHGVFFLVRAVATGMNPDADIAFHGTEIIVVMLEGIFWLAAAPMTFLALAREKTERRIVLSAQTDDLTEIDNRRGFFEKGQQLIAGLPEGATITLLSFDLDYFKAINDCFGHSAGDRILKTFASCADEALGPGAVFARLGGEEFAALLPETDPDAALRTASHIAQRFTMIATDPDVLGVPVTVSIGIADADASRASLPSLLEAADAALYRAKSLGRDRIEWAGPLEGYPLTASGQV